MQTVSSWKAQPVCTLAAPTGTPLEPLRQPCAPPQHVHYKGPISHKALCDIESGDPRQRRILYPSPTVCGPQGLRVALQNRGDVPWVTIGDPELLTPYYVSICGGEDPPNFTVM